MAALLITALHDGSWWLVLACLSVFVSPVVGLYTRRGSEISFQPYANGGDAGELRWGWKPGDLFG